MKTQNFIHRKGAKSAEDIRFMFAAERTANIKDDPIKVHEIVYVLKSENNMRYHFAGKDRLNAITGEKR